MGLEMGAEGVEGLFHQGVVGDACRLPPPQPAEEGAAPEYAVRPLFVSVTPAMTITDHDGTEA